MKPRKNEITFKAWRIAEAVRTHTTLGCVTMRYYRGWYPDLKTRRVNRRVVFVLTPTPTAIPPSGGPKPGEIQLKAWLADAARRLGTTPHAVEMRIHRGTMPRPEMRRAGYREVYVTV